MKVHVTYTIECDYEFDEEELAREYPEEDNINAFVEGWIEEDFARITTRADNVLPFDYKETLTILHKETRKE